MKYIAIIPSGGSGSRTSLSVPKQYLKIGDKELIAYTLEVFEKNDSVDEIFIAAQPEYFNLLQEIKEKYSLTKIVDLVPAGSERQHSVFNALRKLPQENDNIIIVHDAARPLLSQKILTEAIKFAKIFDNVVVATKTRDTLIRGDDFVVDYIDRRNIYSAQTPQIFRYDVLMDSMLKAQNVGFLGTDESMLVYRASYKVKIVEGSSLNFKVTTDEDIEMLKMILTQDQN